MLNKVLFSLIVMIVSLFINTASATTKNTAVIDIYGTTLITAEEINKRFPREIKTLADSMLSVKNSQEVVKSRSVADAYEAITYAIKAKGQFAYIQFNPVFYPGVTDKVYITIDVVEEKDKSRLTSFYQQPTAHMMHDPDGLFKAWNDYTTPQFDHFFKTKEVALPKQCPVFHCVFGFDGRYAKYLPLFNSKVQKNKDLLTFIVANDANEEHRATAVYLLAHSKDGNELIKALIPAMRDSNSLVRNNAMRVLAATLDQLKTADFPIEEAITALNFPYESDRNKALYMLTSLAKQKRYADYIAGHAGDALLAHLKMNQPNLHDLAYEVLKQISGKQFGERDYDSWKAWFSKQHS